MNDFRLNHTLWATFLQFAEVNLLHSPMCVWRQEFLLLIHGLPLVDF